MKNSVFLLLVFFSLKSVGQQTLNEEHAIDISNFNINYKTKQGSYTGSPLFMNLEVDETILISDTSNEGKKKTTYLLYYKISTDGKIYFVTGNCKSKKEDKSMNQAGISIAESYSNNQKFLALLNEHTKQLNFCFYKNGKRTYNFTLFSDIVFSNVFTFNVKDSQQ